nr:integrase, catalytic region, zinc finger, CCHC-type, peptidase aspartic, catalytic [Tanacetum cinerariifolium]
MRRVGKGFSGVETPLFKGMIAAREIAKEGIAEEQVQADDDVAAVVQETVTEDVANEATPSTPTSLILPSPPSHGIPSPSQLEIIKMKARVKRLERANKVKSSKLRRLKKVGTSKRIVSSDDMEDVFNQGRMIDDLNKDEGIELVVEQVKDVDTAKTEGRHTAEPAEKQEEIYHLDADHPSKVLSMQEDDSEVQKVVEVVTTAKLITEVVIAATSQVSATSATISAAKPSILLLLQQDKGKGILIETPKPMKKKDQIELDAEYARKLHEEIKKDIDWDAAINHKAAKRRKLNEEAQEVEDLKKHLEVVDDEDNDVFTEATPLARKTMFEKPDGQDAVWKSQRSVHGLALLLELMLLKRSRKNTKCVNAADEELTAAKHKLMNIKMTMSRMQLNSKFVKNMLPEWGRFVTAVKLNRGLRDSNYNQLYAYLKQHETHAKKNKMMLEQFSQNIVDPLALMFNVSNLQRYSPSSFTLSSTQVPQHLADNSHLDSRYIAKNCTQPKRPQNSEYYKDKMLLMQAQENRVALDAEQADDCDAFDSDVDEAITAQTMFMANLSSADFVTDEAGPSYDSDILSEVQDHDHYQDAVCAHHEEH